MLLRPNRALRNPRFVTDVDIIRPSASGTYDEDSTSATFGLYTPPVDDAPLTISASVQPASGNDLRVLPEGERNKEGINVFSTDPLASTVGSLPAEFVNWRGYQWKLFTVAHWEHHGYYHGIGVKVQKNGQ